MKLKIITALNLVLFLIAAGIGIYYRSGYEDYNEKEMPLENFEVGLISDTLFDMQLQFLEEDLDSNHIIIAAKCRDTFHYRFSCCTQPVEVEHVFQGEGLEEGDRIEIARFNSGIFSDKESYVNGNPQMNLSFVNEMIPGNIYLIFLDRRLETYSDEIIYIQSDGFIIAPIFCYTDIQNVPCKSDSADGNMSWYSLVKDNEFFLMSWESIDKMRQFKEKLLDQYAY